MSTIDAWRYTGPVDRSKKSAAEVADDESGEAKPTMTASVRVAVWLTYAATAATAWNGWKFGGLRLGDMLIALALVAFFVADGGRLIPKLPAWVWQFGAVIILVTVAHEVLPTSPAYLDQRLVINGVLPVPGGLELETNGVVGIKFLVPAIFMPLMFAYLRMHDPRYLLRAAYAFALGTAISSAVAMGDLLGATHLSLSITHIPAVGGRAPGLTLHPNFLAMTCVLSLPIMLYQLIGTNLRTRVLALAFIVALLLGLYASGSRAGAAVGPATALLAVIMMPRYRKYLPTIILLTGGVAAALFVLKPSLGHSLLQAVRLGGDTGSAQGSDLARKIIFTQGVDDFQHSPIDGVGLQVAEEAHNVYLQALAAGGVILLAGYLIFILSGLVTVIRNFKVEPLAYPLFVSALGGAIFAIVQAALTDRLAYVPLALIATLPKGKAREPDEFPETQRWTGPQRR